MLTQTIFHLLMSVVSAALGACIGSFLNVVIYRLPRGLSSPTRGGRSALRAAQPSPATTTSPSSAILLLRGRCRRCHLPISIQYPLVELATALLFVATYDVLSSRVRVGVGAWPQDGVLVAIHWICWAGLLATAVMDIEAYHLDIRVTWDRSPSWASSATCSGRPTAAPAGFARDRCCRQVSLLRHSRACIALFRPIHRERLSPIEEPAAGIRALRRARRERCDRAGGGGSRASCWLCCSAPPRRSLHV